MSAMTEERGLAEAAADLNVAAHAANFIVQPFAFGKKFDSDFQQALIDVALRQLLTRDADLVFGV